MKLNRLTIFTTQPYYIPRSSKDKYYSDLFLGLDASFAVTFVKPTPFRIPIQFEQVLNFKRAKCSLIVYGWAAEYEVRLFERKEG